jgi:hypothetical protein
MVSANLSLMKTNQQAVAAALRRYPFNMLICFFSCPMHPERSVQKAGGKPIQTAIEMR